MPKSPKIAPKQTSLDEQLTLQKAILEEVQALSNIGNWEWDITHDQVMWSSELYRILGVNPNTKASYKKYLKLVHTDDRTRLDKSIRQSLKTGRPFAVEHRLIREAGGIRFVLSKGQVFKQANKAVRMVGVSQDITGDILNQRQLDAQLEKLERMNRLMIGRELKMIELKKRIKELEQLVKVA